MQQKNKNDSVQLSTRYQQYCFAKRHLREQSGGKVFPIGGTAKQTNKNVFIGIDNHRREGKLREYKGTCPTLNTNNGGQRTPCTIEDAKIRRLTPIECERLQGFPDDWTAEGTEGKISDTQRYKMCGNAVSVPVVKAIMEKLI